MANLNQLKETTPARIMIVGYPGTAKTGSLVSLINAGYKVRVLDFDGNIEPLLNFADPAMFKNVDVVHLADKLRSGAKFIEPDGVPEAFSTALRLMDHWKYTNPDGTVTDLGRSKEWGLDTIVVVDSLTSMGDAAFRRAMVMQNKSPGSITQQVWMLAMQEQNNFIEKLTDPKNGHHVIVLSHLKMISPKDVQNGDDSLTKELKEKAADIIPTKLFPSALGQNLPPTIGGHFPTLLLAESDFKGSEAIRKLKTVPRPELDLKVPAPNMPKSFDISDGLFKIFDLITAGNKHNLKDTNNG